MGYAARLLFVATCVIATFLYFLRQKILLLHRKAKQRVDSYVERAKVLLRSQSSEDVKTAVCLLEQAIEELPPWLDPPLIELKARALMRLHQYEEILDLLEEYLPEINRHMKITTDYHGYRKSKEVLHPDEFWKIVFLGQACYHLGRLEEALALLQRAKWQSRMAAQFYVLNKASSLLNEDNFDSSDPSGLPLEALNRLIAVIKFLVRRRAAGEAAFANKMYYEAVRQYSRVLESKKAPSQPLASAVYLDRAASYEKLNRYPEAIADCNKAQALIPECVYCLWRRSLIYKTLSCFEECSKDLNLLLEIMCQKGSAGTVAKSQQLNPSSSNFCWRILRQLFKRYRGLRNGRGALVLATWTHGGTKDRSLPQNPSPGRLFSVPFPETVADLEAYILKTNGEFQMQKECHLDYKKVLGLKSTAEGLGSTSPSMKQRPIVKDPKIAFRIASLRQNSGRVVGFMDKWGVEEIRDRVINENSRLQKLLESALEEAIKDEQVTAGGIDNVISQLSVDLTTGNVPQKPQLNGREVGKRWRIRDWPVKRRSKGSANKSARVLAEERAPVGGQFDSLLMWLRIEKPVGGGLLDEPDLGVVGNLEDLPLQSLDTSNEVGHDGYPMENEKTGGRTPRGIKGMLWSIGTLGLSGGVGSGYSSDSKSKGKEKGKEKSKERVKEKKEKGKEKGKEKERSKGRTREKISGEDGPSKEANAGLELEKENEREREKKDKGKEKGRVKGMWRGLKVGSRDAEGVQALNALGDSEKNGVVDEEAERFKKLSRKIGIITMSKGRIPRKVREEGGESTKLEPQLKVPRKFSDEGKELETGTKEGFTGNHKHLSRKLIEFGQRSISPLRRPRKSFALGEEKEEKSGRRGFSNLARTESSDLSPSIFSPCPTRNENTSGLSSSANSSPNESSGSSTSISVPSSPNGRGMSSPLLPIQDTNLEESPRVLPRFIFPRKRSKSLETVLPAGHEIEVEEFVNENRSIVDVP